MKAITLWQPWASLMVGGVKLVETRSWPLPATRFAVSTGPLPVLIHAGLKWDESLIRLACEPPFVAGLLKCGVDVRYSAQTANIYERRPTKDGKGTVRGRFRVRRILPLGAVVGFVRIAGCVRTENIIWDKTIETHWAPADGGRRVRVRPEQKPFGDFAPGRWAWFLTETSKFLTPVPYKGGMGFFDIPEEALGDENSATPTVRPGDDG